MAHKNLLKLLERGEDLDKLAKKTEDMNKDSVEFNKRAKKQNKGSFCKIC